MSEGARAASFAGSIPSEETSPASEAAHPASFAGPILSEETSPASEAAHAARFVGPIPNEETAPANEGTRPATPRPSRMTSRRENRQDAPGRARGAK
jgi:hypothetical protein